MKKEKVKELFTVIYFGRNLEDVKSLYTLKDKSLKEWCDDHGRELCEIFFTLACEGDLEFIYNKLCKKLSLNEKESGN